MIIFFLINLLLWKEDFIQNTIKLIPDNRNPVRITYNDTTGCVHIEGNPENIGRSSCWLYIEKLPELDKNAYLSIYLKGDNKLVRFRIILKEKSKRPYYYLTKIIKCKNEWSEIKIFLKDGVRLLSSNYPYALTPDKEPDLFLFIENGEPGIFSIYIDKIRVIK